MGTDESGKGDYFGPLVIAGVWVDHSLQRALIQLGVRDSKLLSDERCQELGKKIREIAAGKYEIVEISPKTCNQLYEQLLREQKNLNHLLAWVHSCDC
jgi:ribonuclease HIII